MRTVSEAMAAMHQAVRDGTYRPDLGSFRSVQQTLMRMSPEELQRLRSPWPSLSGLTLNNVSQPAVMRLLRKTVEER